MAAPLSSFDVLYRVLRDIYGKDHVRYVRNITDVEDKINAAARDNGEPIAALTAAHDRRVSRRHGRARQFAARCRAARHRAHPADDRDDRAADRVGHAYAAEGHVLFAVASDADYGQLSGRSRDEMIAGARVEVAPYKRDPADFVLWKPSDRGDSPAGTARGDAAGRAGTSNARR